MSTTIRNGLLVTLDSGEGSGKTTTARALAEQLRARGFEVVLTREPGGSPLAEAVRAVALQDWAEGMTVETEALLMYAARAAHLNATILPALARGCIVIVDRFIASSRAYQVDARGMAASKCDALNEIVLGAFRPDLTLVLDCPVDIAMQRVVARSGQTSNRFDNEARAFHEKVRTSFLAQASADPQRFVVIDASRDEQAVLAASLEQVLRMASAVDLASRLDHSSLPLAA